MERRLTDKSRKLSWLLRHGAGREGIAMDAAGWVDVGEVLARLRLDRAELEEVVRHNNKARLQWEGNRIRCCQGHSLDGMPVTRDALERSWRIWQGGRVWHGTRAALVPAIAREGLVAGRRSHVHLAPAVDSVVGKRASVDVLLEVDPEAVRATGLELYVSPNGVVLARAVPPSAIVELRAMTRRARQQEAELAAHFASP